jgi:hypothetical protein
MDNPAEEHCQFVKANGERCKGTARPGSTFCMFHHPAFEGKRAEGRSKGGKGRGKKPSVLKVLKTLALDSPDMPLEGIRDVVQVIARTVNAVMRGEIHPSVANSVGCLLSVMVQALKGGVADERMAALEEIVTQLAARKSA